MKLCAGWLGLSVSILALSQCLTVKAADEKPSGKKNVEIKIQLKDFKFKPPEAVTDPDSVFVFDEDGQRLCYYTNGPAEAKFKTPTDGDWDLIVSAAGDTAAGVHVPTAAGEKVQDVHPNFQLEIDGKKIGKEVTLKSDDKLDYKITAPVKAGEHKLSIAFTNDTYKDGEYDSNFYLYGVKLTPHQPTEANKKAATSDANSDAKK